MTKPLVAVTFGDASGIGPELVAKLLARPQVLDAARIVVVGDAWVWAEGQRIAGAAPAMKIIRSWDEARNGGGDAPMFLEMNSVAKADVLPAQVTAAAGQGARLVLTACLGAVKNGKIDAICFAPLNKQAMKKGGMAFEDELHFFADYFGVTDYFCE
jgi:4-hydroxythreonine-4-phosphate dehydrogenase